MLVYHGLGGADRSLLGREGWNPTSHLTLSFSKPFLSNHFLHLKYNVRSNR